MSKNTSGQWKGHAQQTRKVSRAYECFDGQRVRARVLVPCLTCALYHTYTYTSTEAMVELGSPLTLRRPRYSELNSSPKKELTQVPPAAPYSHVLSAPIVVQNRKLYSTRVSPAGITNHLFSMRRREIGIERKETILIASKTFLRFLRPVGYVDAIFFYIKVMLVWPGNRLDAISRPWIIGPFGETTKKKWTITPRVTFLDVLM